MTRIETENIVASHMYNTTLSFLLLLLYISIFYFTNELSQIYENERANPKQKQSYQCGECKANGIVYLKYAYVVHT